MPWAAAGKRFENAARTSTWDQAGTRLFRAANHSARALHRLTLRTLAERSSDMGTDDGPFPRFAHPAPPQALSCFPTPSGVHATCAEGYVPAVGFVSH